MFSRSYPILTKTIKHTILINFCTSARANIMMMLGIAS